MILFPESQAWLAVVKQNYLSTFVRDVLVVEDVNPSLYACRLTAALDHCARIKV
jgi:hypothetical protein